MSCNKEFVRPTCPCCECKKPEEPKCPCKKDGREEYCKCFCKCMTHRDSKTSSFKHEEEED